MAVDREALTDRPPPSERVTLDEVRIEKSPELMIAEAAVEQAFARAGSEWRRLVEEQGEKLLEGFEEKLAISTDVNRRLIRKLRDDVTAKQVRDELERTPSGAPEDVIVLIVDDDPGMLVALRRLLESRSMKVFDADGPEKAMNVLDLESIDVVLSDIRMPKNGELLFEYVRGAHPGCEVVLMSGGEESEAADKCLQAGAFDFIAKPFRTIEEVILTVTRAAEHRKLRRRDARR